MTVLPFGRSAIISASMLGLGRALGETMAVAIVLSVSGDVTFNLISSANPSTIAANIALDFPESSGVDVNALIASGLVLFAVTLVVNMAARAVINRADPDLDEHSRLSDTRRGRAAPTAAARPARRRAAGGHGRAGCRAARRSLPPVAAAGTLPAGRRGAPSLGAAVASRVLAVIGFNLALFVVATAILGGVALYAWSRAVEGRAGAPTAGVTLVVTRRVRCSRCAPLVSLLYTVIDARPARASTRRSSPSRCAA